MKRNNINLISTDGNKYKFVVEINDTSTNRNFAVDYKINYKDRDGSTNIKDETAMVTFDDLQSKIRNVNYVGDYIPTTDEHVTSKMSEVKLYFPEYAPELFVDDCNYLVEIFVDIERYRVYLHSGIHTALENVANENIFKYLETTYYEYLKFEIVNPYNLLYGDEFDEFRKAIEDIDANITSSVLNVVITPLDDDSEIHTYINYGTTALQVNQHEDSYMKPILSTNTKAATSSPCMEITWNYNNLYSQDDDGLKQYFKETYTDMKGYHIRYELIIFDDSSIYKQLITYDDELHYNYKFDYDKLLLGWELYKYNLKACVSIQFLNDENYDLSVEREAGYEDGQIIDAASRNYEVIMELRSTTLNLTPEVFKFFAKKTAIFNINLNKQDMNNYTFNIVNKVQKNVINLERPSDYKANIIKPVFYKVRDLSLLYINQTVTENIQLDLDAYKSKTDFFYLQVEGVNFAEIGRTSGGVIFKVYGNKLPGQVTAGTYYILDADKEMITSGSYEYK